MKRLVLKGSIIASMAIFGGCSLLDVGGADTANNQSGLIPPSAQPAGYAAAPIAAPTYPPMNHIAPPNGVSARPQSINVVIDKSAVSGLRDDPKFVANDEVITPKSDPLAEPMIPNSPMLTENNVIELNAVGMGIPPENTISPGQAMALAKRAAIVDAYRQIGEKMYGIRLNAQDTVKDMVVQNSVVKTKVQALIRNAEINESIWKDGVMQVSMQLKLDGRIWHRVLSGK